VRSEYVELRKAGACRREAGEKALCAFAGAQALGAEPGPRKIVATIYVWPRTISAEIDP